MIGFFLSFFAIFILVLYPNSEFFSLNSIADFLTSRLPSGFKGFIAIIRYWYFSLFYIMAEAWSTIMLSLLLWIFVVDVLSIKQAKRYYAFFGSSRNFAGVIAGILAQFLANRATIEKISTNYLAKFLGFKTAWDQAMLFFITIVILCGLIIMSIYRYLHVYVYPKRFLMGSDIQKKGKQKVSLKESILYALKSKYVLYITLIVLSYNIISNLNEVLWKAQMKELFPISSEYTAYTSKITYLIGIIATISSFFVSGNLIRRLGWKITALVTPIVLMGTGLIFFYFLFLKGYSDKANLAITFMGISPIVLAVFFGSLLEICSRSLKYTIFDDTKEMAFIPLSPSEKLKGKAAIDGVGSRIGKSGGSLLMQILIIIFSSSMGASPYIFGIIILIFPIWIISINRLSKQFEEKSAESKDLEITPT
jgi:AAA family ATP:ADP antiporter